MNYGYLPQNIKLIIINYLPIWQNNIINIMNIQLTEHMYEKKYKRDIEWEKDEDTYKKTAQKLDKCICLDSTKYIFYLHNNTNNCGCYDNCQCGCKKDGDYCNTCIATSNNIIPSCSYDPICYGLEITSMFGSKYLQPDNDTDWNSRPCNNKYQIVSRFEFIEVD